MRGKWLESAGPLAHLCAWLAVGSVLLGIPSPSAAQDDAWLQPFPRFEPAPRMVRLPPVEPEPAPPAWIAPPASGGGFLVARRQAEQEAPEEEGEGGKSPTEPIGEAPQDVSELFLRQASVLLKPGEGQFEIGASYLFQESRLPVVLSNDLLAMHHQRQRVFMTPLSARLGVFEKGEVFAVLPVGMAFSEFADLEADSHSARGGLGDITAGLKYLLREETDDSPDVIFALSATAPTGSSPFGGTAWLGSGVWAVSTDLNFIKTFDPIVVFSGVGYTHQFARDMGHVDFQPGELFRYSFGLGFAVNEYLVLSTQLEGSLQTYSYLDETRIPNSLQEPVSLRLAITRVFTRDCFVEPYVLFGLTSDAPDVELGAAWTYGFGRKKESEPSHDK